MKKLSLILLLVSLLEGDVVTKVGTTAAQFLKIGIGSRATAMGEAFVAVANDATALYWNPSGIAWLKKNEFFFNHINWLADIKYSYFGMVVPVGRYGVVGGSIASLSTGDMMVRTVDKPEGTGEYFNFSDLLVGVTYAKNFTDRFSFGVQMKYAYEKLWHMTAGGFALDISLLYIAQFHDIRLGMNFANFGGKFKLEGEDTRVIYDIDPAGDPPNIVADLRTKAYDLPLRFQVGIAGELFKTDKAYLTLAVDAVHPNDNTEYLNLGAELGLLDILFLRGGYRGLFMKNNEGGLSFGAGLKYRAPGSPVYLSIDYSYVDYGRLKGVSRYSLGVAF